MGTKRLHVDLDSSVEDDFVRRKRSRASSPIDDDDEEEEEEEKAALGQPPVSPIHRPRANAVFISQKAAKNNLMATNHRLHAKISELTRDLAIEKGKQDLSKKLTGEVLDERKKVVRLIEEKERSEEKRKTAEERMRAAEEKMAEMADRIKVMEVEIMKLVKE